MRQTGAGSWVCGKERLRSSCGRLLGKVRKNSGIKSWKKSSKWKLQSLEDKSAGRWVETDEQSMEEIKKRHEDLVDNAKKLDAETHQETWAHSSALRMWETVDGAPLADEDCHANCQANCRGVEASEWENLCCKCEDLHRAVETPGPMVDATTTEVVSDKRCGRHTRSATAALEEALRCTNDGAGRRTVSVLHHSVKRTGATVV